MSIFSKEARKLLMLAFIIAVPFSLVACETMEGAGEDLEDAGEAIQEKANE
jgi:predicted small secreted protein